MADDYETEAPEAMQGRPFAEPREPEDEFLRMVREQAVVAADAWSENHDRAEQSVDFKEGINHWPASVVEQRGEQPCLVLNDMPIYVARICGEQLQNKQSIHIHPDDGFAADYSFQTDKGEKRTAAQVREGIARNVEYRSNAEAHYDRAHEHAVDGGIGWLRVYTRYASRSSFDQEIVISSVRNRWSVLLDTENVEEPDMSDARYGFVFGTMRKKVFEREYPNAMLGELGNLPERARNFWGSEATIGVAEYMERRPEERELVLLSTGQTGFADQLKDTLRKDGVLVDLDGKPVLGPDDRTIIVTKRRPVVDWCVYWRKMTAWSILEGGLKGIKLPFSTVPLVPVLGRTTDRRDGSVLLSSAIYHAQDSVRMDEYWMSAATSRVALAPMAPWVGPVSAFEGQEHHWSNSNRVPKAYLPYNDEAVAPPTRADPPTMPVAEIALAGQMHDRKKATIGVFDASLGAASNETSGKAINARDRQSSTSTYVYGENLRKAIRRVGILVNEAIPIVYDTQRTVRLQNEDGTGEWITINKPGTGQDGKPEVQNSLGAGSFGVVVQSGPSYITQRQESSEAQLAIMQAAPQVIPIMLDTYAENSDWPGADKLALRARKMMDPNLLTASEREEMAEESGQQVDPATGQPAGPPADPAAAMAEQQQAMAMQVMEAQTAAQMKQAEADAAKAEAQIATAAATKAKADADMAEAQMRMAALQQGGLAPQLPTVGANPEQEMPNG